MIGPAAVEPATTEAHTPSALFSFSTGNVSRIIARAVGISIAPNTPCATRKAITNEMLLAVLPDTPIAAENKAKPIIPMTNTFLCPKRSPTLPIVIKVTAEREQVPVGDPLDVGQRRVQVRLDRRVGHRDDRAVQRHHHHPEGDRHQCQVGIPVEATMTRPAVVRAGSAGAIPVFIRVPLLRAACRTPTPCARWIQNRAEFDS